MEVLLAGLPFLVLLACPLAMVYCMYRMRGGRSDASQTTQVEATPLSREERIASLEGRMEELRTELTTLQGTTRPAADRPHRADRLEPDRASEAGPVTPRPA